MHEMGSHGNGRSARIDPVARQPDQIKIVRGPASRAPATAGVASTTSPIKTKLSKSSGRLKATTSPIASRAPISPSQVNPPSILDRSPITATLAVNAGRSPVNEPRTPPWSASHVSSTATSSEAHTPLKNRTTPRQMNLWNELLDGNAPPESPSDLNVHILQISRDSGPSRESPDVSRSSRSHVDRHPPRRSVVRADRAPRKRLIDALEEGDHAQGDTKVAAREGTSDVDEDRPDASQHTDVQRSPPPTAESVSQGPVSSIISGSQLTSSQGPVASQPGGPRITYARDRTYLTEKATDEAAMLNTPLDTDLGLGSQGRRAVTSKTVARSFGLDEEEDGVDGRAKGGIRSIHELRQAGGNKRFLDESEALFEDIEARHGSALSRRRNGMIELGSKMVDKRFARQFLDRSLDHRLFRGLDRDHDSITGFALASIFAVLTHERVGPSISPHARDEGIVSLLTRLLDDARDLDEIAKDRRANVSKASRGVVHDFAETIRRSAIWTSPAPEEMTPRLMALRCLEILSRRSPEASDREEVLPNETVRRIVLILSSVGPDDDEAEAPASEGLGVELALSILESCTMRAGSTTTALICDGIGTSSISNILVSASGEEQGASTARHALALRLILNLTNNNASACNALASWGLVAALVHSVATGFSGLAASLDDTERLSSLDQLILALATMINLAEGSETARQYMWRAPDEHEPLLDDLLQPFLAGLERATQADSMEASHSNVAFGYLAVLLANLCLDGTIKDQVRGRLPGGTVRPLSDAAEEFLHYHQKVDEQLHASGGDSTGPDGFTARLQHVVNRLKQK
ncbi:MAG: hypothetical protein M1838_005607 [Thelocarpon superellum]|nr:MAG: hypothetical protein M1838_005607 [Thelocarpon superellum]